MANAGAIQLNTPAGNGKWFLVEEPIPKVADPEGRRQAVVVLPAPISLSPPMEKVEAKVKSEGRMGRGRAVGGKLAPVKTILVYDVTVTSAANTALASVTNMRPDQCIDWASYAALYDECIVDGFTVHALTGMTLGATVRCVGAFCLDPTDLVAPAGVSDALSSAQHFGPFVLPPAFAATGSTGTIPVSTTGAWTAKFRVPRGTMRSNGASTIFGHDWSSCADTGDIYCFLKTWIDAAGAGIQTSIRYLIQFHMRFRSRH